MVCCRLGCDAVARSRPGESDGQKLGLVAGCWSVTIDGVEREDLCAPWGCELGLHRDKERRPAVSSSSHRPCMRASLLAARRDHAHALSSQEVTGSRAASKTQPDFPGESSTASWQGALARESRDRRRELVCAGWCWTRQVLADASCHTDEFRVPNSDS